MAQLDLTHRERLDEIAEIIRRAENRASVDTPDGETPPPTFNNITQDEMQRIYDLARGETWD